MMVWGLFFFFALGPSEPDSSSSSSMAKIYSENCLFNRQRLSGKAPDEELAVVENGDSR